MNLILLDCDEVDDRGRARLTGRRARHIRDVLRAAPGDRLRIGLIRGPTGSGEVVALDSDTAVELRARWDDGPTVAPEIDLVLAMPRPKVLARVLQTAASMGVRRIDLVNAWRVDKSHLHSKQVSHSQLHHNVLLGCEQGGATWVPDIAVHRVLMPFMRGPLTARTTATAMHAIIAHPRAEAPIERAIPRGTRAPIAIAVGPERGWIDRELDSFVELGFTPVTLGARVLRVDTAVTAALAQLHLLRRL